MGENLPAYAKASLADELFMASPADDAAELYRLKR
jgi:hypothetical protein